MGETFKYCAPVAGALGFSAEDTAEAIGLMANAGIKSSQAGTALRTIMTNLTGDIELSGRAFGDVTVSTTNADGSMRSLGDILQDLRGYFGRMTESEAAASAEALVGKNAMSGFLAVMNAGESDVTKLHNAIATCSDQIDGYNGTCEKMAAVMQDNLEGQLTIQNIKGLSVEATSRTEDWYFHITPRDSGGHFNIVNLVNSVIIPAMEKYGVLVKTQLDIQNREIKVSVGKVAQGTIIIETDLPNIIRKNITIKSVSADVNKLIIYDASDYETKKTYYLHNDLSYDTKDTDRITPVNCEITSVKVEEGSSFESAAISEAYNKFANLSYSNLIELTMMNGDILVRPDEIEFGQIVRIISDGVSYTSILTGRERGTVTKLIFGTVRLDLTKILRRNS